MFNDNVNFIYFNVKQIYMDSKAVLLMLVLGALLAVPYAVATPGGGSVQGTATDKGSYSTTPGTIDVTSGHIYLADITAEQSTYHWAGVYGNATGTLVLGDGSSNVMYTWDANANYVLFAQNGITPDWTTLAAATCTEVETSYTFLSGASDSCSKTFTTSGNVNFVSLAPVTGTIEAQTFDGTGASYWKTFAIKDGTGNVVFAGEVDNTFTTNAYDGTVANYQVILPEDGNSGDTTPTTYNIWVELV